MINVDVMKLLAGKHPIKNPTTSRRPGSDIGVSERPLIATPYRKTRTRAIHSSLTGPLLRSQAKSLLPFIGKQHEVCEDSMKNAPVVL